MIPFRSALACFALASFCTSALAVPECTAPPSGLLSWYRAQKNAADTIGTNDGTVHGPVAYAQGKVGSAFQFDGGSYVSAPNIPELIFGTHSFTVDVWVNFDTISARSPFVAHDDGASNHNKWIFWYDEQGHDTPGGPALRFHINGPDLGPKDPVYVPWSPVAGRWYHLAVTRDVQGATQSVYTLYINGAQKAQTTSNDAIRDAVAAPLTIGGAEGYFFTGKLDETDIFDRALTADEILALYSAGSAGKCVPESPPLELSVTGMSPTGGTLTCTNVTTGATVEVPVARGIRTLSCEEAGLVVHTGDTVRIDAALRGKAN